jgi:L-threonylcarbamoyladenylate synthase
LTLVLEKTADSDLSDLVSAGLSTVALRVPAHPIAQKLLSLADLPVAAPSANRSGHVSPTTAQHVQEDFGDAVLVLDGGAAPGGLESTVIDARGETPVLLRPGGVARADIERVAGVAVEDAPSGGALLSPGQMESHYAPRAGLRLDASEVQPGEALLAFGPDAPVGAVAAVNLSASCDLRQAAANLFRALRDLDASGAGTIAVMPIPETGLGEAINDRLRRAAAGR